MGVGRGVLKEGESMSAGKSSETSKLSSGVGNGTRCKALSLELRSSVAQGVWRLSRVSARTLRRSASALASARVYGMVRTKTKQNSYRTRDGVGSR